MLQEEDNPVYSLGIVSLDILSSRKDNENPLGSLQELTDDHARGTDASPSC